MGTAFGRNRGFFIRYPMGMRQAVMMTRTWLDELPRLGESKVDDNLFKARFEKQYRAKYDGADPAGFTALDYVGALGSVSDALLYSRLFWPEFTEVDGMVFLRDFVDDLGGPEGIRKMRDNLGREQSVEKSINNFDVNLSFPNYLEENAEGDDLLLANQLADMWSLRLQQLYPHRSFHVEVNEDNGSPCVCFVEVV